MCWNKEISIVTFIVVIVIVIILYNRNLGADRHLAIFSVAVVIIQLLEFFAWLSIEKRKKNMNQLVTRLILITLWSQPLINSYMAYRNVVKEEQPKILKETILLGCIGLFSLMFLIALINASKGSFKTKPGSNCHLIWTRNNKIKNFMSNDKYGGLIYLIGLFLPLLFIKPFKKGLSLVILGAILLAIARSMSSKKEFGSWWCWIAFVFVVAAYFYKTEIDSKESKEA